jgi:hypothetical protein
MLLHHRGQVNMVDVGLCRLPVLRLLSWDWSALKIQRLWSVSHWQLLLLHIKINGDFLLWLESLLLFRHLHVSDFEVWCNGLLSKSSILVERIQKRLVCSHLVVKNKTRRGNLVHGNLRFYW